MQAFSGLVSLKYLSNTRKSSGGSPLVGINYASSIVNTVFGASHRDAS